ncbi:FAD/NAD(P)-binding protein [Brevibacterium album]|uniref:FAD/NAD(P)-binding protein n=1 Tax=Brevibacterium album TaxID=417948 RepID=UPI0003FF95BC|nr:FAD/NAD(P)-binding protein [Brevibacterium album]
MSPALRIGIVGAGPRGLIALERLLAHARTTSAGEAAPSRPAAAPDEAAPSRDAREQPAAEVSLDIRVFDPHSPGPGRVWRTDQPGELLMNTVLDEQTVFPDSSCRVPGTGSGPSMPEWAGSAPASSGLFPRRREYGEYLAWSWDRLVTSAPAHVRIVHEACEVRQILDLPENADARAPRRTASAITEPSAAASPAPQALRLSDGRTAEVDAVILCVGHIPAALSDERAAWKRFADAAGLVYLPPGLPAETPVDLLPAGEPVLIRGFGLNFFDLQALLTCGRGGVFEPELPAGAAPAAHSALPRLRYLPSGREPVLIPGSRRGVPYRCKPLTAAHPLPVPPGTALAHFTAENIAQLPARPDGLRFDEQLWPLILADLRRAWYTALARSRPEVFREDPALLHTALAEATDRHLRDEPRHEAEQWHTAEARALDPAATAAEPGLLLDLHRLLRPLDAHGCRSRAELRTAMLDFLRADLAASLTGPELSPEKALFPVLWQARLLLKELVAEERVEPASFVTEVRGWFEDFVSGICDGPPPQRFAELIALAEAGIVDFAGPQVRIGTSRAGEPAGFTATSSAVDGELRARALVDASSPANRVTQAADRLIRGMLDRGQLTAAEHRLDETTVAPSTGLAVTGSPYRTVDARGRVHPARFVLSLQLSSVQLGLAIAANPQSDARIFRDADAVARAVLALC